MKYFIFIVALLFSVTEALTQNPSLTQQAAFGGSGDDYMELLHIDNDKNIFFAGSSNSNNSSTKLSASFGDYDVWLLKTDENFNRIWDKSYGGDGLEIETSSLFKNDVFYVLSYSYSGLSGNKSTLNNGGSDLWLLCLDLNGSIIWQQNYGGTNDDSYGKLVSYTDTSLLIVSQSNSGVSGNKTTANIGGSDLWLFEVGIYSGQLIRQKNIGSSLDEISPNIFISPYNNHIYISCSANQGADGDKTDIGYGSEDFWMIELDEDFTIIKNKCFGGDNSEYNGYILFEENGFLLNARSSSSVSGNKTATNFGNTTTTDAWIIRLDLDWNILWDKTYGGSGNDNAGYIFQSSNGNYIMTSNSKSNLSGNKTIPSFQTPPPQSQNSDDLWLLFIDKNGDILHQEVYGGRRDDYGVFYPLPYSNTELLLVSNSSSGADGNKTVNNLDPSNNGFTSDLWVAKVDAHLLLNTKEINDLTPSVSVYPNPFSTKVTFSFQELNEDLTIRFFTIEGKLIESKIIIKNTFEFVWETHENEGVIFYEIQGVNSFLSGKLVQF